MLPPMLRTASSLFLALVFVASVGGHASAYPLDHLADKDDIGLNKVPNRGVSHILVIPSRVGTDTFPPGRWASLQEFYNPAGGPGTFREYWQVVSNGAFDPIPTLVDPVMYVKDCPIPGRDLKNCTLSLDDIELLGNGSVQVMFNDLLGRVRDEQSIDLSDFDVNGVEPGVPDGYFDGVIIDTDLYQGVGFPLAALGNEVVVDATGTPGSAQLTCGIVALVPPGNHEFGHLLGFLDLYYGPSINGLMRDVDATLSAYSRQQIGWGEVERIDSSRTISLAPVLDGGSVVRIGDSPRYVMIENRGGQHHAEFEQYPPGIYVSSVNEAALPNGPIGFLDLDDPAGIYIANRTAPYLNVNLPLDCSLSSTDETGCSMNTVGAKRDLIHAAGDDLGFSVRITDIADDGTITLKISNSADGGCSSSGGGAGTLVFLLIGLVLWTQSRRRSRPLSRAVV